MNRRTFLVSAGGGVLFAVTGCLGDADHQNELEAEIERRGVEVRGMELSEGVIKVEYDSENTRDDLAEVAMAFVERVDAGWQVDRLDGLAREDSDLAWHAETTWARAYLDDEIEAGEYGDRISETLAPTVVVGDDGANETEADDG